MKKFIISSSIAGALLLGGTLGAFAAANSKTLEVFFNVKDIKINQVSSMPKDKPFTYQGTTYVPLRFISEELGYPVKWDGAKQTIHIGKTADDTAYYPQRDIKHMNFQASSGNGGNKFSYEFNAERLSDNVGNKYSNYITLGVDGYWTKPENVLLEFPLNGQYNKFEATMALTEKSMSTNADLTLDVYLDENLVESYSISAGDMPTDININLKKAVKIGFKLSRAKSGNDSEIGLFNAKFYK